VTSLLKPEERKKGLKENLKKLCDFIKDAINRENQQQKKYKKY
jgi:hypothetical protein